MSQQNPTTFENQNIKLEIERHPGCKVIFSITTLPLATKAAKTAAIKAISKQVSIPGFRAGRAPENLVVQQFDSQIKREFLDILARNSLNEASQLSQIRPLSTKSELKLLKCEPIDETSYRVMIELQAYPEVPFINPSDLTSAHHEPEPVTEDQIQAHIDELQLHHAEWQEVTDRKSQEGDFVTLDIALVNEDQTTQTLHENSRFRLKEKHLPTWLKNLAQGLSLNETKTGQSEPEQPDETNFKSKTFTITLKKVEQPKIHPLDKSLAKKAGVESVEKLREAIQKSLEKESINKAKQSNRKAIRQALLDTYPFDLPKERVDAAHQECHEIAETHENLSHDEMHTLAHQMFDNAKNNLRFSYLLSSIFHHHHLKFPDANLIRQRATEEMLMRYMRGEKNITENDLAHFSQVAENEIVAETALDFLLEKSKRA